MEQPFHRLTKGLSAQKGRRLDQALSQLAIGVHRGSTRL